MLAAPVCWLAGPFGAEVGLSLEMQHPSSLGGKEQKAPSEDCLCPWTLPGAGMEMQLNNFESVPCCPFSQGA